MSSSPRRDGGGGGGGNGGRGGGADGSTPALSFKELLARVHVHPSGAISGEQVATLPLVSVFDLLSSASAPALYSRHEVPRSTSPRRWPTPAFPSIPPSLPRSQLRSRCALTLQTRPDCSCIAHPRRAKHTVRVWV